MNEALLLPIQDGTNWYIYCSNNLLNMIDPTGLNACYAVRSGGAGKSGHAAARVGSGDSYTFYSFEPMKSSEELDKLNARQFSSGGMAGIFAKTFTSYSELTDFMKSEDQSYDRFAEFETSELDDDKMWHQANKLPGKYNLVDNNCADYANRVLEKAGITGISGFYPNTNFDQIVNGAVSKEPYLINDGAEDWRDNFSKTQDTVRLSEPLGAIAAGLAESENERQVSSGE